MARRVILDTGVLIALERGKLDVDALLGADDAVLSAVTAMELLVGVERANPANKQQRSLHVEAILQTLPVVHYTLDIARIHARMAVFAMASGKSRSAYDMIIAATAAAEGRILLTTDASADFGSLPGVNCEVVG
jgi:tRNA(fMet)-specific endonuclease VapC